MPKRTTFNITPARKSIVVAMLEKQHTIGTLATSFGVTDKTMSKALKKAGIIPAKFRQVGIANVKSRMFERLELVDKDDKYVELAMKIVDKYDVDDEVHTITGSSSKSVDSITAKIMLEMSSD